MKKPKRPLKPFKSATWNAKLSRWEGIPPKRKFNWLHDTRGNISFKIYKNSPPYDFKKIKHFPKWKLIDKPMPKKKKRKPTKRQKEQAIYRKLKPIWRANPKNHYCSALCKTHGILTPAESYPHHKKGRVGELLNKVELFMPICEPCHTFIHNHKAIAYKKGWLIKSSSKL